MDGSRVPNIIALPGTSVSHVNETKINIISLVVTKKTFECIFFSFFLLLFFLFFVAPFFYFISNLSLPSFLPSFLTSSLSLLFLVSLSLAFDLSFLLSLPFFVGDTERENHFDLFPRFSSFTLFLFRTCLPLSSSLIIVLLVWFH